jgi:hypothetical protein
MMEQTSTTGSVETTVFEKKTFASQSRRWNRNNNPRFAEIFPELAAEPVELPAEQLPPKARPSSSSSSATTALDQEKQQGVLNRRAEAIKQLQATANLLQNDVIGDDLRSLLPDSRPIRIALIVALASYLLYRWLP